MSKIVCNMSDLLKELKKDVRSILNETSNPSSQNDNNPVSLVKDYIDWYVYDAYTPKWYERTYELRESVTASPSATTNNNIFVNIYHDPNKFTVDEPNFQHGSSFSDKDMTQLLPDILNDSSRWGWIQGVFSANGKWRFTRPYIELVARDLRQGKFKLWLGQQLINKGYKVLQDSNKYYKK